MKTRLLAVTIASLLALSFCATTLKVAFAENNLPNNNSVVVILGNSSQDPVPLNQIQRMLEHKGLLYSVAQDPTATDFSAYDLIIVLGSTLPTIEETSIEQAIEGGTGLIWIGQGLPDSLSQTTGVIVQSEQENTQTAYIDYSNQSTMLFNETITLAEPTSATVQGYFLNSDRQTIAPAEFTHKQGASGTTYYFAYDACSYWFADPQTPWLRAYRLNMAIENTLASHPTIRLTPYPNNAQTAFIIRIEDVDPLHTDSEWLNRANNFLQYSAANSIPLSIGLTPTYIDPENSLNISINAITAQNLRTWLSNSILAGGAIIQHGYTHQIGEEKTGIAPEFYNTATDEWLPMDTQQERIREGKIQITQALGFTPKGFEAPHYIGNQDTYQALTSLGFNYVTHNTDTAFTDRQGLNGLVNIPETLGYIPLEATRATEDNIKTNINTLYDMGAVLLVFNHLFDDSALNIGKNLIDYVNAKPNLWKTSTDALAEFWQQRFKAYDTMSITTETDTITVNLGPSSRPGLTLSLDNTAATIQEVRINNQPWPTFTEKEVILPAIPEENNIIKINLNSPAQNVNLPIGLTLTGVTSVISLFYTIRTKKTSRKNTKQEEKP